MGPKEEKLKKALLAIEKLSENDYEKLKKLIGVGNYLYRLLADILNDPVKEDLKIFDKYSLEKRIAILNYLREILQRRLQRPKIDRERKVKPFEYFLTPIEKVEFLTAKEVKLLKSLGINTVLDALYYFPYKYKDRRLNKSIRYAQPNTQICVKVKVVQTRKLPEGEPYTYEVIVTDGTDQLALKFRYKDFRALLRFKKGSEWIVCGRLKQFAGEKYIVHPEVYTPSSQEVGRIVPVYYARKGREVKEISSRQKARLLAKAIGNIVRRYAPFFPEILPYKVLEKYYFPTADVAFKNIHSPPSVENFYDLEERKTDYQRRFIYEDLLVFSLALLLQREKLARFKAPKVELEPEEFIKTFEGKLPFKLTNAQRRVIKEILSDMAKDRPMNRLLQGDVGSGKTDVAMATP